MFFYWWKVQFTFPIWPSPNRSSSASKAFLGNEGSLTRSSCKKTTLWTTWVTFLRIPHTSITFPISTNLSFIACAYILSFKTQWSFLLSYLKFLFSISWLLVNQTELWVLWALEEIKISNKVKWVVNLSCNKFWSNICSNLKQKNISSLHIKSANENVGERIES